MRVRSRGAHLAALIFMELTILGTRGEVKESGPYHSRKSGVLVNGEILLDCGEAEFIGYAPRYILITHLHPDHAFFVRDKKIKSWTNVFVPEKTDLLPNAHVIKTPLRLFTIGHPPRSYKVRPIPTVHSVRVKSVAYLLEHKNRRILYTGDMIWIKKEYHKYLHKLDLVITEGSFMRKHGVVRRSKTSGEIFGHTGIPDLVKLFSQFAPRIVLVHFGAWFFKDMKKARAEVQKLAKAYNVSVTVGYDGLEVEVP